MIEHSLSRGKLRVADVIAPSFKGTGHILVLLNGLRVERVVTKKIEVVLRGEHHSDWT